MQKEQQENNFYKTAFYILLFCVIITSLILSLSLNRNEIKSVSRNYDAQGKLIGIDSITTIKEKD